MNEVKTGIYTPLETCRSRARKAKICYEELPEQSPQSQIFLWRVAGAEPAKPKILWRVAGAEPAKPKFYEELPEKSPQNQTDERVSELDELY